MLALNNRWRPDVLALKPFGAGGELGDIFYVRAGLLNRKVRILRPTWRHRKATAGGGALMDLGVQALDLALWMLDYPRIDRVLCHLHPGERMEVEDSAALTLKCARGPVISLQVTWNLFGQRDRQYLEMLGTRGSASLSPMAVYKEVEQGLLDVTPGVTGQRGNIYTASYRQMLDHFAEACRGECEQELPVEQVELMRILSLAYESAARGKEIKL
ncbi:MAG TPA: Gfo/Idh/MocA family oxidoreductase, partial [Longimicrobiales bacterium]|nr:Gfo/Idh/MocA family oxidoreductase [Longimicrobiales bacterium]